MTNDDFVHPTLAQGAAIRVLTLLPGQYDDQIRCITQSFLLSEAPPYNALSYTWGAETNSVIIELNGNPFTIRNNLWCFLRRLRKPGAELILWCDMTCIDQNNLSERGHQVRLMGPIYRSAACVWIWLGEQESEKCRLLDLLLDIGNIQTARPQNLASSHYQNKDKLRQRLVLGMVSRQYGTAKRKRLRQTMVPALLELLTRDYWSRVWIIQEVALARDAVVHCGSWSLQLAAFWSAIGECTELSKPTVIWPSLRVNLRCYGSDLELLEDCEDSAAEGIRRISDNRTPGALSSLSRFLAATEYAKCADSRDRIYGVLAMTEDMKDLDVDYRKSTSQLFTDTLELMTKTFTVSHWLYVSQLQRALELDANTIQRMTLTLGHDSARSYKYVLTEHVPVIRVTYKEDCTEVWTREPKWSDRFVPSAAKSRKMSALRAQGFQPTLLRPAKLVFEHDEGALGPKVEVGDRISELHLLTCYESIYPEHIRNTVTNWYPDIPHCLMKATSRSSYSFSLLLPKRQSTPLSTALRKQKVRDFYTVFSDIGSQTLGKLKNDDWGIDRKDPPHVKMNRMQHQLILTMHLD